MISKTSIDNCMDGIYLCLMRKHGCTCADRDIEDLRWYIQNGRASTDFLVKLIHAKPFMVANRLHNGGSTEEKIKRIKSLIGIKAEI